MDLLLNRVALPGQALSADSAPLAMNHAGWVALVGAVRDPASYPRADELLTADGRQLYGALLRAHGERYGEELNGSRRSGWGDGQSRDFQQTAPFVALATNRPLPEAVAEGLQRGWHAQAIPAAVAKVQVAFWMRDLFDIVLLDHLLSQQDRVGNIDFTRHWAWVEDGRVRSLPAGGRQPPPDSYRRLIALADDLRAQGPLHDQLRSSYGFSATEFAHFVANTVDAAETLRASCKAGRLRFDLDADAFLREGRVDAVEVDCDRP